MVNNKLIDTERVLELIISYNYLVRLYDIPQGELGISLDDGYTGDGYYIDIDNENINCSLMSTENEGIIFAIVSKKTNESYHGNCKDYTLDQIGNIFKLFI